MGPVAGRAGRAAWLQSAGQPPESSHDAGTKSPLWTICSYEISLAPSSAACGQASHHGPSWSARLLAGNPGTSISPGVVTWYALARSRSPWGRVHDVTARANAQRVAVVT